MTLGPESVRSEAARKAIRALETYAADIEAQTTF